MLDSALTIILRCSEGFIIALMTKLIQRQIERLYQELKGRLECAVCHDELPLKNSVHDGQATRLCLQCDRDVNWLCTPITKGGR